MKAFFFLTIILTGPRYQTFYGLFSQSIALIKKTAYLGNHSIWLVKLTLCCCKLAVLRSAGGRPTFLGGKIFAENISGKGALLKLQPECEETAPGLMYSAQKWLRTAVCRVLQPPSCQSKASNSLSDGRRCVCVCVCGLEHVAPCWCPH